MDITTENEMILDKWKEKSLKEEKLEIVRDGILYKGEIVYRDNGCWEREPGDEAEIWHNANPRILVITKDMNDDAVEDLRIETGRKNHSGKNCITINGPFHRKYLAIVYALTHTTAEQICPPLNKVSEVDLLQCFDNTPMARINAKKQNGGPKLEYHILNKYIKDYGDLLKQQIDNLDADILVCSCCNTSHYEEPSFNPFIIFLNKHGYNFEPFNKEDNWIYYDEVHNKIAINTYHPSYTSLTLDYLDEMSKDYRNFLIAHPNGFKKNKR
jgi:hypothetical protein